MKNSLSFAFAALIAFAALPLQAATATFTNGGGNGAYTNSLNWSGSSVPDTSAGDTARIANGSAVTYTPGDDLTIGNGGVLQVSNGSFTQVVSGNYIQLTGNGTVLVDGGTFNQGTASSNPFNISGTGNLFKITAGTVNISSSLNLNPGMTYLQTGGTVNVAGDEIDFNSTTNTLSGGTLNAGLITGVNAAGNSRFDIAGGTLNLTGAAYNGIYAGDINQHLNFVTGSTGKILFSSGSTTITDVQNFVNEGVIQYNSGGTSTLSAFSITSSGGVVTLALVSSAVPEPSTYAVIAGAFVGVVAVGMRRRVDRSA